MSKLPDKAQTNLSTFLARLKKDGVIHYCVVRPGPTGKPLGIFAAKSTAATVAGLKKVYGGDEGLAAPEKDWVCARGAIQVEGGQVSILPASKDNDVKGDRVLPLFRDLKKSVGKRAGPAALLDPLLQARVGEPVDTATLDPKPKEGEVQDDGLDGVQGDVSGDVQGDVQGDVSGEETIEPEYDVGPVVALLEPLEGARDAVRDALVNHDAEQPRDQVQTYVGRLTNLMQDCIGAKDRLAKAVEEMPEDHDLIPDLSEEIELAKAEIQRIGQAIYDVQVFERNREGIEFAREFPEPRSATAMMKTLPQRLKQNPRLLVQLVESGNQAVVDKMMEGFGKATLINAADRKVMKEAFNARFGIKEMSVGSVFTHIPKLYEVMKLVPPSHTRGNNMLNALRYDFRAKASDYDEDAKKMTLHLTPSGRLLNIGMTSVLGDRTLPKKDRKVSFYKATTLHEIGHGFDAMIPFMSKKGKEPVYGGWRSETPESVARAVGEHTGFFDEAALNPVMAENFLKRILERRDVKDMQDRIDKERVEELPPLRDCLGSRAADLAMQIALEEGVDWRSQEVYGQILDAITEEGGECAAFLRLVLDEGRRRGKPFYPLISVIHQRMSTMKEKPPKISDLLKHPAVAFCKKIMCDGDSGVWDKSDSGAGAVEIDKRVYQESYKGTWWSYLISARQKRVSNYQFRSPDEWFAELYAAYYMKTLPATHDDYTWLHELDK